MSAQLDIASMSYFCRFEAFFVFKYPFGRKLLERLTSDFRYEKKGCERVFVNNFGHRNKTYKSLKINYKGERRNEEA